MILEETPSVSSEEAHLSCHTNVRQARKAVLRTHHSQLDEGKMGRLSPTLHFIQIRLFVHLRLLRGIAVAESFVFPLPDIYGI